LALTQEEQGPGLVMPAIGNDVQFEIKNQFIRELQKDRFSGSRTEDAHEHIDNVLYVVSLFNIPGVSHDAIMLRVFPMTLTGGAKRWIDRLLAGTVNTWTLLKKYFILRY
jgi:hypothetical protein